MWTLAIIWHELLLSLVMWTLNEHVDLFCCLFNVFVVLLMCLWCFEMQGIIMKHQLREIDQGLCCVYAHGKGHLVTLPCAHTRQRHHVAQACAPGKAVGVPGGSFPCALGGGSTTKRAPRQNDGARQCLGAWRSERHTAMPMHTAKKKRPTTKLERTAQLATHDSELDARQKLCRATMARRSAKIALPSMALAARPVPCCTAKSCFPLVQASIY
jgi:hypothetical protein